MKCNLNRYPKSKKSKKITKDDERIFSEAINKYTGLDRIMYKITKNSFPCSVWPYRL